MPNRENKLELRKLPDKPGVYIMYNALNQILYVGKANSLKKRVAYYFQKNNKTLYRNPKINSMVNQINHYEYFVVKSESEALILESNLIKKYKPKYNTSLKDDKRFLLIEINHLDDIPKFKLTRNRVTKNNRYYGPFPHSGALRKTLNLMKNKFGVLLYDSKPKKLEKDKWRLYDDVRSDITKFPNITTESEYNERVKKACDFLEGKTKEILSDLHNKMQNLSASKLYEKAGLIRDQIMAIEYTAKKTRKFNRDLVGILSEDDSLEELRELLSLRRIPLHIECFDISHISGSFCVGSMICFEKGKPNLKKYRRYKIKSFVGNDDYKAIKEIITRRYSKVKKNNDLMPDLIIIDGGKGQVSSAMKALKDLGIEHNALIGLAKKDERIIIGNGGKDLLLSSNNSALKLLQRARDEAHAYANNFNAELRSKKIRESILDELKGLGESKKILLLKHFGSINELRQAKIRDFLKVKGIGEKTAASLINFLKKN